MTNSTESYTEALRGYQRVAKTVDFIQKELPVLGSMLFLYVVFFGQQANFILGVQLVTFLVCLRIIGDLGMRYAARKRDEAMIKWVHEVTGHLVGRRMTASLRSGFMQVIAGQEWRYSEQDGVPQLTHEGAHAVAGSLPG